MAGEGNNRFYALLLELSNPIPSLPLTEPQTSSVLWGTSQVIQPPIPSPLHSSTPAPVSISRDAQHLSAFPTATPLVTASPTATLFCPLETLPRNASTAARLCPHIPAARTRWLLPQPNKPWAFLLPRSLGRYLPG